MGARARGKPVAQSTEGKGAGWRMAGGGGSAPATRARSCFNVGNPLGRMGGLPRAGMGSPSAAALRTVQGHVSGRGVRPGGHATEPGKLGDLNGVEERFREAVSESRYIHIKPHIPGHANVSCERGSREDPHGFVTLQEWTIAF